MNRINTVAANLQSLISYAVKHGTWRRSFTDEAPTRANIKRSIPWWTLGLNSTEIDEVMDIILAKMR